MKHNSQIQCFGVLGPLSNCSLIEILIIWYFSFCSISSGGLLRSQLCITLFYLPSSRSCSDFQTLHSYLSELSKSCPKIPCILLVLQTFRSALVHSTSSTHHLSLNFSIYLSQIQLYWSERPLQAHCLLNSQKFSAQPIKYHQMNKQITVVFEHELREITVLRYSHQKLEVIQSGYTILSYKKTTVEVGGTLISNYSQLFNSGTNQKFIVGSCSLLVSDWYSYISSSDATLLAKSNKNCKQFLRVQSFYRILSNLHIDNTLSTKKVTRFSFTSFWVTPKISSISQLLILFLLNKISVTSSKHTYSSVANACQSFIFKIILSIMHYLNYRYSLFSTSSESRLPNISDMIGKRAEKSISIFKQTWCSFMNANSKRGLYWIMVLSNLMISPITKQSSFYSGCPKQSSKSPRNQCFSFASQFDYYFLELSTGSQLINELPFDDLRSVLELMYRFIIYGLVEFNILLNRTHISFYSYDSKSEVKKAIVRSSRQTVWFRLQKSTNCRLFDLISFQISGLLTSQQPVTIGLFIQSMNPKAG